MVLFGPSFLYYEFADIKYTQIILKKGHIDTWLFVRDKPRDKPLCMSYTWMF